MERVEPSVGDYTSSPVYSVTPETSLISVRDRLDELKISCLAVIGSASRFELLGIVTRTDLFRAGHFERRHGRANLVVPDEPVSSVMTPEAVRVAATAPLALAAHRMVTEEVHRVFVQDDTGVMGVCSTRDVMRALVDHRVQTPLEELMSSPVEVVRADQPASKALLRMHAAGRSGLVVLDQGWPCGLFTRDQALIADGLDVDAPIETVMDPALVVLPSRTPVFRAAATAAALHVRRVVVTRGEQMAGIVTGLDFCRAAA